MGEKNRKGDRETEQPYFPWVYLLIRLVVCFMEWKTLIIGKHFIYSCSSKYSSAFLRFPIFSNSRSHEKNSISATAENTVNK